MAADYLNDGLDLVDAAKVFHDAAFTPGARIEVNGGSLSGEGALERSHEFRDIATTCLIASVASSLDRVAAALEAIADTGRDGGPGSLGRFSTAELSAELAERLKGGADKT